MAPLTPDDGPIYVYAADSHAALIYGAKHRINSDRIKFIAGINDLRGLERLTPIHYVNGYQSRADAANMGEVIRQQELVVKYVS